MKIEFAGGSLLVGSPVNGCCGRSLSGREGQLTGTVCVTRKVLRRSGRVAPVFFKGAKMLIARIEVIDEAREAGGAL